MEPNIRGQGKYDVVGYHYPDGVGVNKDLLHYVQFFIAVRGKSKFKKTGRYQTTGEISNTDAYTRRDNSNSGAKTAAAAAIGLVVGGAVASSVKGIIPNVGGSASFKAGRALALTMAAGIPAGIVGFETAKSAISGLTDDRKARLKSVITLAMQERPTVSYGVNYQDKDMGILGGFLTGKTSISDTIGSNAGGEIAQSIGLEFAKIPSILPGFGNASLGDIVQLGAKVKTNPFREVFFEGVDYRKFNFRYKFMPKSEGESKQVKEIIQLFKEHMHPELSDGGYFYIYPSEFSIEYIYNDKVNGYFNKIASCALTDMTVDYGGEQFASFDNGAPSEINLTLSFRELELVTKDSIIAEGY